MDPVKELFAIAWAAIGGLVMLMILAFLNRYRLSRKNPLPIDERYRLQAHLLDYIKDASANRRTPVDIRPYWRSTRTKPSQRNAVLDPLIRNHDVDVHDYTSGDKFTDWVTGTWNFVCYRPPTHVTLTDRTWERMVQQGASGHTIIIERVQTMNWQSQNTNGGDIVGSPQTHAAGDALVRTGSANKHAHSSGLSAENLADLMTALRADAKSLPGDADRVRIRALADKIDDELDQPDPDDDKLEGMVQRATRYVADFGGLLAATGRVIDTWRH